MIFYPLQRETIVFGQLVCQTETRQIGNIIMFSGPHDFYKINTPWILDGSLKQNTFGNWSGCWFKRGLALTVLHTTVQYLSPALMKEKWWTMCPMCGQAFSNVMLRTVLEFKRHFSQNCFHAFMCGATWRKNRQDIMTDKREYFTHITQWIKPKCQIKQFWSVMFSYLRI